MKITNTHTAPVELSGLVPIPGTDPVQTVMRTVTLAVGETVDIDEKSISVGHALRNSLVAQVPEPAKAKKADDKKADG